MSDFDDFAIEGHREAAEHIGVDYTIGGATVTGIESEIDDDPTPGLHGRNSSTELQVTFVKSEVQAAHGSTQISGETIQQTGGRTFRVAEVTNDGGGLITYNLINTNQTA